MKKIIPNITMLFLMVFLMGAQLWGNPLPVGWRLADTLAPARFQLRCAFDQSLNKIICFGGQDASGLIPGDTWEFFGEEDFSQFYWNRIDSVGPEGRIGHAICYDIINHNIFLFGGLNQAGQLLGDTWIWHDSVWTKIDSTGPAPRADFVLAYDSYRQRVVLFGGVGLDSLYGDTWEWNNETGWELKATNGPSPRVFAGMAYNGYGNPSCVLYAGQSGIQNFDDVWIWDGQTWTQAQITGPTPPRRMGFAMTSFYNVPVIFGGQDSSLTYLNDCWSFDNYQGVNRWQPNPPFFQPNSRALAAFCEYSYWRMAIIGGIDTTGLRHDVWIYPLYDLPDYVVGDINGSRNTNGVDVVYGVSFFKGGPHPPYSQDCIAGNIWYVAGDVNASCSFNGVDITYMVAYFKGGPSLHPCPDCPPAR
jgi:hypothetical protein